MRVYVAGLYSRNRKGETAHIVEVLENMKNGIEACTKLLELGHQPFCPWLDYLFFLMSDFKITEKQIKDYSIAWLEASEALVLLDNWENSPGSVAEKEAAEKSGIPIFYGIIEFQMWYLQDGINSRKTQA